MTLVKEILGLIISLSAVFGIFTGIINKMFNKKLQPLEQKIDANEMEAMKRDMNLVRANIINFASDLHRGVTPTKYQFDYVFDCMNSYEDYVKKLEITNNLFTSEEKYIKDKYMSFIDNNK